MNAVHDVVLQELLTALEADRAVARECGRHLHLGRSQDAPYIFHAGAGRRWDQGPRSFQCSRRADALKLWVALERHGTGAFGLLFDYLCDLALELHARVVEHPRFEPLHRPDCNILCFRYLPPGVADRTAIDELNRRLRQAYNTEGTGWITTTVLNGQRVLRVTLMNPCTGTSHLDELLQELDDRALALLRA